MIEQVEEQPENNNPRGNGNTVLTGFVSIIIPTYNEADNIVPLVERIHSAMEGRPYEILFVDDNSQDGTADTVASLVSKYPVKVLIRRHKRGLATAIIDGLDYIKGEYVCVMDADLQHPPEVLPDLFRAMDAGHDLVIASRYIPGGGCEGWKLSRRIISKGAIAIAHFFLPDTRSCSDPMSGFFAFNRKGLENAQLNPLGYKILLEIELMGDFKSVSEVPFTFVTRTRGESKLSTKTQKEYLKHIYSLMHRKGEDIRLLKFLAVGASGIVVNQGLLFLLKEFGRLALSVASPIAIEASIISNFLLNDAFTFHDRRTGGAGSFLGRLGKFNLVSLAGAAINFGTTLLLTQLFGIHYLISNLIGIFIATMINYLFNNWWTWK
jgi:dolichol-phosphate mannosyltransferase